MQLRALLADDEPPARARLRRLLEREPDIEVVGECSDGDEAVAAIRRTAPDVVFLDIQMPELSGFEVLRAMEVSRPPAVIFVTAYDTFAVQAFDAQAVDYLLKPVSRERLQQALERVRTQRARDGLAPLDRRLYELLEELRAGHYATDRILVKAGGRMIVVRPTDVEWVEAAANYVRLHVRGGTSYQMRESMKSIEAKLPPSTFLRIHRSAIVNVDRIRELHPWFHGEYVVVLQDGTQLTAGRAYVDRLHQILR